MKINELRDTLALQPLSEGDTDREVSGGYTGDLLSFVMGRCPADSAWITIMNNVNVLAVASLADAACVILAEDSVPDDAVLSRARTEGINLYTSPMTAYELCGRLYALLS
ncbi:MAG: hypothetical protein IKL89_07045 [Clostridia bacterium]|nr:hypothetical protein [Clostridia bacterium]